MTKPVGFIPAWCGMVALVLSGFAAGVAVLPAQAQIVDATALAGNGSRKVDIEADELQVLEKENRAIFSGNVTANRADVRVTSNQLEVFYGNSSQSDGRRRTQITNLTARGNVVIVTRRQQITGAWAQMNVTTNQLTVGGDVTVRQGQSVLRGKQLFVDLNTNQSRLSGGRVKGNFLPGN